MTRKIKIVSDGTPHNTKIIDVETGDNIDGILAIDISITPDRCLSRVTFATDMDIITDAEEKDNKSSQTKE